MTKSVGVHEAKTQLSRLLTDVERGEEIIITSRGRPVARLAPVQPLKREFGLDRGLLSIADDFDAPLPDELLEAFES